MRGLAAFLVLASKFPPSLTRRPPARRPALLEAEALLEKKSYKKPEEALRAIVAVTPGNARAQGDLALALLSQGKTREAVDAGRLAAAFAPETPEARYIYALTLKAAGRNLEQARELEKTVALKPGQLAPMRALAETYAETGDDRSVEVYTRLIAQEPGASDDRAALARSPGARAAPTRRSLSSCGTTVPGSSRRSPADRPSTSRSSAGADYDNDGDPDLAVSNSGGPLQLLRNDGRHGYWLGVDLQGRKSNRQGVGARLATTLPSGRTLVRTVQAGSSYLSSSDPLVLFGLGEEAGVKQLTIHWPSGTVQILESLSADRYVKVEEK